MRFKNIFAMHAQKSYAVILSNIFRGFLELNFHQLYSDIRSE
jgi:hypothetical protein